MNREDKDRIVFITQRLELLTIEKKRILEEETSLLKELNTVITDKLLTVPDHHYSTPVKTISRKEPTKSVFKDRDDNRIDIGDTVSFLTKTKFKGNQAIVHRFSPKRVITLNEDNREIVRTDRNLRIVKKASGKGPLIQDGYSPLNQRK